MSTNIRGAVLINFASKYLNIAVQILFTAVLARILSPEDFGIVAVTTVFTNFFLIFANLGLGVGIIQNKSLESNDLNQIYSFTVYLSLVLAGLFAAFAYLIALFYDNEAYIWIGFWLSFSLLFNTLNVVPNAILLKNKKFLQIGIRTIVVTLVSAMITILLSLIGFKYYAIVVNSILLALFTFIWNRASVQLKFAFKLNFLSINKIRNLSGYQFIFNLVNYFSRNLDNLLIGKWLGPSSLAFYDQAYKLMQYPIANLTHVITPVLHPILSDYQQDRNYIYQQYLRIAKFLSLVGVFVAAFCYAASEEIILIVYGSNWSNTIPIFQLLALSVWAQMVTSSSGAIYQSLGNTRLLFWAGLINTLVTVTAISLGVVSGDLKTIALYVAIAYNLHFLIAFFLLNHYGFERSYFKFLLAFLPDVTIMVGLMSLFKYFAPVFKFQKEINISLKLIAALMIYGLLVFIFRQQNYLIGFFTDRNNQRQKKEKRQ